ncbi:uncharacterized protein [Heliangelus exortis]|uniref:uncharacterized protein isoform X2 n=1 Tax=Heliangelus exortis TaxID=472823 RepID=UPI003A8F745D
MEEPEKERKLLGFGPGLKGSVDAPTPPLQNRTRPTAHRTPLKEPGLEGCHAQEHPWPELTGFSLSRCHIYMFCEHLEEWWLPHCPGQPVPMLGLSFKAGERGEDAQLLPGLGASPWARTGLAKPEAGAVPAAEEPPEEPRLTGALELCVTEQEALKQWLCGELQAQVIAEKTGVKPVDTLLFLLEEFIAPVLSAAQLAFIRKTKYFLFMHQKRVIIGFKEL